MARPMTPDEMLDFLDEKPRDGYLVFTSIGPRGYPHTVPLSYFRVGTDLVMGARAGTQKLRNVERDPRVSISLEDGNSLETLRGLLIEGDARVVAAGAEVLELAREGARSRGAPESELPTEPRPGTAYIRVTPRRWISWDYSKSE
ncbi:MAG: pyridoxamine 5'-phosphate oxidase family protein [Chloroflexi bacterium]|nr:pyridoxamine 5'-phosphate oxidase family protein [Chloroflexota bacterium]